MFERGISRREVLAAIMEGEMIEEYLSDRPYPSCLLMRVGDEPLHVVAAVNAELAVCHIITVYRPDSDHFEDDLRTRRRS
jgi:hypothetical protein